MSNELNPESPRPGRIDEIKSFMRKTFLERQSSFNNSPRTRKSSIDSPLSARLKQIPDEKLTTDIIIRMLLRKDKPDEIGQMLYKYFREHKFFRTLAKSYSHIEEDEAFSHIMKSSTLEVFAANQLIYREGEMGNGKIYLVLLGEVDLYKRNSSKTPRHPAFRDYLQAHEKSRRMSNASSFDASRSHIVLDGDDRSSDSSDTQRDNLFLTGENHGSPKVNSPHRNGGGSDNLLHPMLNIINKDSRRPSAFGNELLKPSRFSINVPALNIPDSFKRNSVFAPNILVTGASDGSDSYAKEIKLTARKPHKENTDIIVQPYEYYGELEEKKLRDDYFGDKILGKEKKRLETAIAASRTEVVVLKKAAFEALEKKFNKMKMHFKQHMIKYFPCISEYSSKNFLETLFLMTENIDMVHDTQVIKEGVTGEFVYSLVEGTCEVYKQATCEDPAASKGDFDKLGDLYRHSKGRVIDLAYVKLEKGAFIGEEILLEGNDKYNYTVRVISSNATFLRCTKQSLLSSFPSECSQSIIAAYQIKRQSHKNALTRVLNQRGMTCKQEELVKTGIIRVKKTDQTTLVNYSPNQHARDRMKKEIIPLVIANDSVEFKLDIKPSTSFFSPKKAMKSSTKTVTTDQSVLTSIETPSPVKLSRSHSKTLSSPRNSPSPTQNMESRDKGSRKSTFFALNLNPVVHDIILEGIPEIKEGAESPIKRIELASHNNSPTRRGDSAFHTGSPYKDPSSQASSPLRRLDSGSFSRHFEIYANLKRADTGTVSKAFENIQDVSAIPESSATPSITESLQKPKAQSRQNSPRIRPQTSGSKTSRNPRMLSDQTLKLPKSLFSPRKEPVHVDVTTFVSPRASEPVPSTNEVPSSPVVKEKEPQKIPIRLQHIPKLANFDNFIEKMQQFGKYDPKENGAQINSLADNLKAMTGLSPKEEKKMVRSREMLMMHRMGKSYPKADFPHTQTSSLATLALSKFKDQQTKYVVKEDQKGDFLIISTPMSMMTSPRTTRNPSPRTVKIKAVHNIHTARPFTSFKTQSMEHTRTNSGVDSVVVTTNGDSKIQEMKTDPKIRDLKSESKIIDSKHGSARISPSWSTRPNSYLELDTPTQRPKSSNLMKKVGGFAIKIPQNLGSASKETLGMESVKEIIGKSPKTPQKTMRRVKSAHIFVQNSFPVKSL